MTRRLAVVAVAAVLVVLFGFVGHRPAVRAPWSGGTDALARGGATTWYCPMSPAGLDGATGRVVLTAFGGAARATLLGYATDGAALQPHQLEVPAHSQVVVPMADLGAGSPGASVQVHGGPVTVEQRITSAKQTDQATCTMNTGTRWYFPQASSLSGSSSRLWLVNPFPDEVALDIRIVTADSARVPAALRGVVVGPRTSRMIDLGAIEGVAELREQFAVSVEARDGRVVAGLVWSISGSGLRLQTGVADTATSWVLADSFGGEGVTDRLVVFNPAPVATTVRIGVRVSGVTDADQPDPFIRDVAARRYATIDLDRESRLPRAGLRWIRVDSDGGRGVVVSEGIRLTKEGGGGTANERPAIGGGVAEATGARIASRRWYVGSVDAQETGPSVVRIVNPSGRSIAQVRILAVVGGTSTPVAAKVEVPAGESLAVDVSAAAAASAVGLQVDATEPVVVSSRTTSNSAVDFAITSAVPDARTASPLEPADR
ncbi:MAG: DUF5719 family protein [Microthrixaceae bacterium]